MTSLPDDYSFPPETPTFRCEECGFKRDASADELRRLRGLKQARLKCPACGCREMVSAGDW